MQTVLPRLKQNLKHFYSGNISIDFMLNIFIFLGFYSLQYFMYMSHRLDIFLIFLFFLS